MAAPTVSEQNETNSNDDGRPQQRSTLIRTVSVASFVMLFGVGIPLSLYMDSWVNGFAVGAFTALWGGPGFGLMAGMALHTLHIENWEKKHGIAH
ncbi:MAG: hypothetical protein WBF71_04470 [Microthrixaceae bacterium]